MSEALAPFDDGSGPALYAGGAFTTAGGAPASHIARWNGVSWSPLGAGTDSDVRTLVPFDDGRGEGQTLFAGGHFLMASGSVANRVAQWDGCDEASEQFVRGDCNNDGQNDISDPVYLLGNLFPSGPPNPIFCADACDANNDGAIDIADAIAILSALFGEMTIPLPPPDVCGVDPGTPDALDCADYPACP